MGMICRHVAFFFFVIFRVGLRLANALRAGTHQEQMPPYTDSPGSGGPPSASVSTSTGGICKAYGAAQCSGESAESEKTTSPPEVRDKGSNRGLDSLVDPDSTRLAPGADPDSAKLAAAVLQSILGQHQARRLNEDVSAAPNDGYPSTFRHDLRVGVATPISVQPCVGVVASILIRKAIADINGFIRTGNASYAQYCPAIAKIRNRFRVGVHFLDTAGAPPQAIRAALQYLNLGQSRGPSNSGSRGNGVAHQGDGGTNAADVVIGMSYSSSSLKVSNLLEVFQKPIMCFSSTNSDLSDKSRYPYCYGS